MHRIGRHLTYANVMVTILAFIVLGGGTALAAYVVSSNSQVGPGTISGHSPPSGDHANVISGSLNGNDFAAGAVSSAKLGTSAVTTAKIANGAVTVPKLAVNARGARGYGRINGLNGSVTSGRNITSVTHPGTGVYCITLSATINPASVGLVVTPDFSNDSTGFVTNGNQSIAEWDSTAADCPTGRLEVRTGVRQVVLNGSGDVHEVNNVAANQSFFVVVP
jgi:hypothetical protein